MAAILSGVASRIMGGNGIVARSVGSSLRQRAGMGLPVGKHIVPDKPLAVNDELMMWDNGTAYPEPCIDRIADTVGKGRCLVLGTYAKLTCTQGWFCPSLFQPPSKNIAQFAKVKICNKSGQWNDLDTPQRGECSAKRDVMPKRPPPPPPKPQPPPRTQRSPKSPTEDVPTTSA